MLSTDRNEVKNLNLRPSESESDVLPLNYAAIRRRWNSNPRIPDLQSGSLNHLDTTSERRRQDLNLHTLSGWRFSGPLLHQLSDYGKKAAASILETTACIDNISFEDQVFLLWMAMYSIPQLIDQQLDCDWRLILREICLMVIIVFMIFLLNC